MFRDGTCYSTGCGLPPQPTHYCTIQSKEQCDIACAARYQGPATDESSWFTEWNDPACACSVARQGFQEPDQFYHETLSSYPCPKHDRHSDDPKGNDV
jgi:hypothetical protein